MKSFDSYKKDGYPLAKGLTKDMSLLDWMNTEGFTDCEERVKEAIADDESRTVIENFKEKFTFPFELLSDEEEKACELFGVIKMKNMYGKQVRGIERSTFVIDPDGKLIQAWRGVKVEGHVKEVLQFIKQHNSI